MRTARAKRANLLLNKQIRDVSVAVVIAPAYCISSVSLR